LEERKWYAQRIEEITKGFSSQTDQGLSQEEALNRLNQYGPNTLEEPPSRSLLSMFIGQLKEVLVLILIGAALISGFLGEWEDSIVILIIVVLNAALGVFQENKAEQALKALKQMTKPHAKVLRDGCVTQIDVGQLVPGDIVLLEAGDSIPADLRLFESASLFLNEAALTGESVPVEKDIRILGTDDLSVGDRKNMAFKGTTVTGGRGKGIVVETGMNTQLGKIAQLLQETPPDPTPLQRQLARLGKSLGIAAGVIVCAVFLTGLVRGENMVEMFMTAIALAVAAIPEGLPAVVTIVLALGVTRMSRKNAIIRKLPAVETLGVANYICSDKTGTLTKNEMTVTQLYAMNKYIQVTGTGYTPSGEFQDNQGKLFSVLKDNRFNLLLLGGVLNCDASIKKEDKGYQVIGDPTEGALVVVSAKAGMLKEEIEQKFPRLAEIPFDSGRKMMTTFHNFDGEIKSFTKGAPDILLSRCTHLLTDHGVEELTDKVSNSILEVNFAIAAEGQRVLALAIRQWEQIPDNLAPDETENKLTFVGFFAIQDPPRLEVKGAVRVGRQAGIKTVMITGDHQATALAIAKELGIYHNGDEILTGMQIEQIDDEALKEAVNKVTVYARVSPEHKLRIVRALKTQGHVVAMTGDGVNDAPALKRADIGAAMGITGTEVAKEASDMVLLDDNYATIVSAVEEGRTIYGNIRKAIQYLLSCNTGEIAAIFFSILFGLGSPLTPLQILWLNLVTDGPPALALGLEPPEKGVMSRPPRNSREGVFAGGVGRNIIIQGLVIGGISLLAYWLALYWGKTVQEAHTMAFVTMAMSQLVHSFNLRSMEQSLFTTGIRSNKSLIYAFLISTLLQFSVIFIPALRGVFETALLNPMDWLFVFGLCLVPLFTSEVAKLLDRIKARKKDGEILV